MTRNWGFSANKRCNEPMWSKSVWVSQIQRSSDGSMTDARAAMKSSLSMTVPVSTSTGSAACTTNTLIGMSPNPGTGKLEVNTSMSGAAL